MANLLTELHMEMQQVQEQRFSMLIKMLVLLARLLATLRRIVALPTDFLELVLSMESIWWGSTVIINHPYDANPNSYAVLRGTFPDQDMLGALFICLGCARLTALIVALVPTLKWQIPRVVVAVIGALCWSFVAWCFWLANSRTTAIAPFGGYAFLSLAVMLAQIFRLDAHKVAVWIWHRLGVETRDDGE